jgi:hypothetical protein
MIVRKRTNINDSFNYENIKKKEKCYRKMKPTESEIRNYSLSKMIKESENLTLETLCAQGCTKVIIKPSEDLKNK